jgi:hypothetical protein
MNTPNARQYTGGHFSHATIQRFYTLHGHKLRLFTLQEVQFVTEGII